MHDPAHNEFLQEVAAELVTNGSIEFTGATARQAAEAANVLPRGTSVYLPWPKKRAFGDNFEAVRALHEAGFEAVPHLAARSIPSRHDLKARLQEAVRKHGVHRVLLVGGDRDEAIGPYPDSAQVLEDDVLAEAGIHEVGVAGYPEGHPTIPADALHADLKRKQKLADGQGLGLEIVTQFSFAPTRVTEYCAELSRTLPEVPVYVGMAGPTPGHTLRRYARYCGVSASLRALSRLGVAAAQSAAHTAPEEQLAALAHFCAARESANVIGVHVFSFGGFVESAQWMHRQCRPS